MSTIDTTAPPAISDAELARTRAAAHRYILAGGAIYRTPDDADRDEHIAAVRHRLHPQAETTFSQRLDEIVPTVQRPRDAARGDVDPGQCGVGSRLPVWRLRRIRTGGACARHPRAGVDAAAAQTVATFERHRHAATRVSPI